MIKIAARASGGLAIGLLLLAVCLIVAIAVAVAASIRAAGRKGSATEDFANATRILSQGENYKRTFDLMLANGMDITLIKFNGTSTYSMKNPANGLSQFQPPLDAVAVSNNNWNYRGATVFLEGAGTAAGAEFILFINDVLLGPCQQINQLFSARRPSPRRMCPMPPCKTGM